MTACIVDASVAIKWVVAETGTAEALALLGNELLAPALFEAECANILWKKVRRRELSSPEARVAARILSSFGVELCPTEPELPRLLELALALDHPAYDCVYLALAKARGVPLITADERLARLVNSAAQPGGVLDGITVLPLLPSRPAN